MPLAVTKLLCSGGMWKLSHSGDDECEHLYHSKVFWTGHALMPPSVQSSVGNPDPDPQDLHVFGPPGSWSGTYLDPDPSFTPKVLSRLK